MKPDDVDSSNDSFLASDEEITRLLTGVYSPPPPPEGPLVLKPDHSHAPRYPTVAPAPKSSNAASRQRCRCGSCPYCIDNARWERIFNEKFADPTYYRRLSLRYNSTLAEPR